MLALPQNMVQAICQQARDHHPIECCGLITGDEKNGMPVRLIPMHNAAQSEVFFEFDPLQQLQTWREMEARGEQILVIYHSHTASRPYPSTEDVQYAQSFPEAFHLIVSTDPRFDLDVCCYRIHGKNIRQIALRYLQ